MKKFLRKYPQVLTVVLAILFIAIIIVCYTWGVEQTVIEVNRAVSTNGSSEASVNFDLQGAQKLDLRGLVK